MMLPAAAALAVSAVSLDAGAQSTGRPAKGSSIGISRAGVLGWSIRTSPR